MYETEQLYRTVRQLIRDREYDQLNTLAITKPAQFNWVAEVFLLMLASPPTGAAIA